MAEHTFTLDDKYEPAFEDFIASGRTLEALVTAALEATYEQEQAKIVAKIAAAYQGADPSAQVAVMKALNVDENFDVVSAPVEEDSPAQDSPSQETEQSIT